MASKTKKITATRTSISPFYSCVSEKSNAVRAELPVFRLSVANSETVRRKSDGAAIFHAVRGKYWHRGILQAKGAL